MQWKSKQHFVNRLLKRGFVLIGSGLFSDVLAKPGSDRVIKVGQGDPWPEYVLWASEHGYAGKQAPLVYSFRVFEGRDGQGWWATAPFYVAVMERLESTLSKLKHSSDAADYCRYGRACDKQHEPDFEAFEDAMNTHFIGRYSCDMHDGNWMVQGERLVLTDPFCGSATSSARRWRNRLGGTIERLAA